MSWIYLTHACADFNDATHAASRFTDWGAPQRLWPMGAGIDARCAVHDDAAALAICTGTDADADAARCPATQVRIDAAKRVADAVTSMRIDLYDDAGSPRCPGRWPVLV
ncbi:hypothetical protein [Xanthomonas citri]|uniref:hypothetical protein n=1 Tax=Xanthomonas citri TaxID=346 RepID=UPI004048D910